MGTVGWSVVITINHLAKMDQMLFFFSSVNKVKPI